MKPFAILLLGMLMTLSFGEKVVARADTIFDGNTVQVEVRSATEQAEAERTEKQHSEILLETRRTADATESLRNATWWMNAGTWLLAIFAIIAAFISWRTFDSARHQSRQELRAYLHPFKFATMFPTIKNKLRIIVEIKNFGKTPAGDVRVRSSICIDKRNANPDVSGEYSTVGDIGPEGQFAHYVEEPNTIFDGESNRKFFATNDYAIFATGEILYRDFAGIERSTKFQVISTRERLTDVKNPATGEVVKALSCSISENANQNTST